MISLVLQSMYFLFQLEHLFSFFSYQNFTLKPVLEGMNAKLLQLKAGEAERQGSHQSGLPIAPKALLWGPPPQANNLTLQ